jgi:hypothetical protein
MRTVKRLHPLTSLVLAAGLLLAGVSVFAHDKDASATGVSGRVPMPVHTIEKGEQCVEPVEVMRRDHMKLILHQRDMTMHQGIRTSKYSLKNCVDCHADAKTGSVLGKDGFCESCHRYSAVKLDCFECHSSVREASAAAAAPPPSARVLNAQPQKTSATATAMDGGSAKNAGAVFPPKGKKP